MPRSVLEFKEFNIGDMVIDPTIVMVAKRGSGKSFLTKDIVYHLNTSKKIPAGCVISETESANPFYKDFFPDLFIHYEIKPGFLSQCLYRQSLMIAKTRLKKKQGKKVDPSLLLILDDMLAEKKTWAKDIAIRKIFMNGRHYRLTFILTMQAPLGIEPAFRDNFDYIFLYPVDSINQLKKVHDNYAGCIPDVRLFNKILLKLTEDYRVMMINRRTKGNSLYDKVFWYKAKNRDFMFGSRQFRKSHQKYYNPNHANDEMFNKKPNMEIDLDSFIGKKKDLGDVHVSIKKNTTKYHSDGID